jgi:SAM-dependent methyltransferase
MIKNSANAPSSEPHHSAGLDISRITWGEQPSPWLLTYACAINGFSTRSLGKGFSYCEIGPGEGSDLLFMAAANPEGRFFGIAADSASCGSARDLQAELGVVNCSYHECPLAELGRLDIPPVDFLVLTGVLSPCDMAAHRGVLSFAARHLKPNGVVLCSYRTPHAWGFWEPMIHFLRAAAESPGNRGENIQAGLRELQGLREAGAALFQISPWMQAILDSIGEFDPQTFDRTFLKAPNRMLHFDEVCRDMEGMGLRYAAGLPLASNYPQICLPANLKDHLSSFPGLRLRETWKDLVRMPFFRRDIFTSAVKSDVAELPAETVLGSHLRRRQFNFAFDLPGAASVRMDGPLFQRLADLLAENALSVQAILSSPALKDFPETQIQSGLSWMTALEQIRPFASGVRGDENPNLFRLSRFNTAVLNRQLARGRGDVALASLTLGNGLSINRREALALLALSEAGPENAEAWAGSWLLNHPLPGQGAQDDPSLGQIIQHARACPRSVAALGLSE